MKAAILRNELEVSSVKWIKSCEKLGVEYEIINLIKNDWYERVLKSNADVFLVSPSGLQEYLKTVYDEKLYLIEKSLNKRVFPSFDEVSIYENKRYFSFFAKVNHIDIPRTDVFYYKDEAIDFVNSSSYPIVAKTSIGAAGCGVQILHNRNQAIRYVKKAFTTGIKRKSGPNLTTSSKSTLLQKALKSPKYLLKRLHFYKSLNDYPQLGYVLFQEYIKHDYEWRVVKVGESYFAHKKLKIGEKASGTKLKAYDNPPIGLLEYVDDLCVRNNFDIMAVDILVSNNKFYVNEMQTKWGQKFDFLMMVNGEKGRYVKKNNLWCFEKGNYNENASFDLKLEYIIRTIKNEKNNNNLSKF